MTTPHEPAETPTPRPKTFFLNGFVFNSEEERQSAAESHFLWPSFIEFWNNTYDPNPPLMSDDTARDVCQTFCEGALAYAMREGAENVHLAQLERENEELRNIIRNVVRYQELGEMLEETKEDSREERQPAFTEQAYLWSKIIEQSTAILTRANRQGGAQG